jgi:hypothetical protein
VFNPDRLTVAELSALRDLQRCAPPPPPEARVWERLGERGFKLVKMHEAIGVSGVRCQALTARGYAYRTE